MEGGWKVVILIPPMREVWWCDLGVMGVMGVMGVI